MGFLVVILLLEIVPMVTLIGWRRARASGSLNNARLAAAARRVAVISYIEVALILCMVVAAVMMARGYGAR